MIDFEGWALPLQYDGIIAEHKNVRTNVGMFDTCHMGRFLVEGSAAAEALSMLVTPDVYAMRIGQCRYGFLLREDGGILDDLIVYRLDAARWMLVVNAGPQARDREWLCDHLPPSVRFEDASQRCAKLDVQGPRALEVVATVMGFDPAVLPRFGCTTFRYAGAETVISRTGYTGERGVELYIGVEHIYELWENFLNAGVQPCGLGARDILRLEAGLPLYGHELREDLTPIEAGLDRFASKRAEFIGRKALEQRRSRELQVRLIGFKRSGRQSARSGQRILVRGQDVGWVTSGSFSPTLECAVGLAYIRSGEAQPGLRVEIAAERNFLDAELVLPPFYRAAQ